jgi:hypothetical protein
VGGISFVAFIAELVVATTPPSASIVASPTSASPLEDEVSDGAEGLR